MTALSPRYICHFCGAVFDEPDAVTVRENLDGERGWWTHTDALCPVCGDADNFEPIKEANDDD